MNKKKRDNAALFTTPNEEQKKDEDYQKMKDAFELTELELAAQMIRQKRGIKEEDVSKEEKQEQKQEIASLLENYHKSKVKITDATGMDYKKLKSLRDKADI